MGFDSLAFEYSFDAAAYQLSGWYLKRRIKICEQLPEFGIVKACKRYRWANCPTAKLIDNGIITLVDCERRSGYDLT